MSRSSKKKQKRRVQVKQAYSHRSVTSSHQSKEVDTISSTSDVSAPIVPSDFSSRFSVRKHKRKAQVKRANIQKPVISYSATNAGNSIAVSASMMSSGSISSASVLADQDSVREVSENPLEITADSRKEVLESDEKKIQETMEDEKNETEQIVFIPETLDFKEHTFSTSEDDDTSSGKIQFVESVKENKSLQSVKVNKINRNQNKRRHPLWKRLLLAAVMLMLLAAAGSFGYYQFVVAPQVNGILGYQAIHHAYSLTSPATAQATRLPAISPTSTSTAFIPNDVTISGKNRINILLLGSDNDGKNGNNNQPLAQTDIVVTIDQQTHQVGMLSIPRDLQLTIPGFGSHKMDFAFSDGWSEGTGDNASRAASAAGLVEDTIAYNYGIHIDYYAWVGLEGFVKVIDTAGGVNVDVTHPMVDDNYPYDIANTDGEKFDYQRVYIEAGPQHMDGIEALEYVRTRHSDLIGDFGRSQRQQQVISQLKEKLSTPTIIADANQLLSELNGAVLTDMQLDDVLYLANLARSIDLKNVQYLTLSSPYSSPRSSDPGDTNFVPSCSDVISAISQMFAIRATCVPQYQTGEASVTPQLVTGSVAALALRDTPSAPISSLQDSMVVGSALLSSNLNEASALHSILDILFMTTFESPDAAQI